MYAMLRGSKAAVPAIRKKVPFVKMFSFAEHNEDSVLLLVLQK